MRNNGLKLYQANRIKQAELTPVPGWQYLNGSSGLERLCQSGTLGLALDKNRSFVTDVACADASFSFSVCCANFARVKSPRQPKRPLSDLKDR